MSQPKFNQEAMSKAMYEQEKRERHQRRCNHGKKKFLLGTLVIGIPSMLLCQYCGHSVQGDAARAGRDEAEIVETRKALPSGEN